MEDVSPFSICSLVFQVSFQRSAADYRAFKPENKLQRWAVLCVWPTVSCKHTLFYRFLPWISCKTWTYKISTNLTFRLSLLHQLSCKTWAREVPANVKVYHPRTMWLPRLSWTYDVPTNVKLDYPRTNRQRILPTNKVTTSTFMNIRCTHQRETWLPPLVGSLQL